MTGNDDTPLTDDLNILSIPDDTTWDDRSSVLKIQALPEVLQIADSPNPDLPATTADSITNQVNDAYCHQIVLLASKTYSVFLYDRNSTVVRK